jgi:diguanylate cyclase (GGDEF)-like protein
VVLLPGVDAERAHVVAARLQAVIRDIPIRSQDHQIPVTVSLGIADTNKSTSLDDLLHRADDALYDAKRAGRDQAITAHPEAV